ncbi:sugar phosphate isomerase/epimerase family protein [Agromyces silvae]|uniref:sugar phosphate isomerase/epimerase family protein n=1 Tax=Agromyces silvae TaxID=3388266 RepID=UPI00280AD949|nr:sugar phosphate isomerase/epimerase family protein [Agromyces protaetiae]
MAPAGPIVTVATICFDGFGDEDFAPTFASASELGVRDIEFNAWYPRNLTPAGIARIVERCTTAGLRPAALQVSAFAPGPEPHDLTREVSRWMWLLDAAQRLGVSVVKATGSARGERGGLDAVVALLREVAPAAQASGITIAIENHARNVIEFPEDYRRIFADVESPAIGMCLDTGHFVASGVDPLDIVDEFAARVVHVDLKDCTGAGGDFVRFGEGVVDFDTILSRVVATGYTGHLVVELPLVDRSTMIADLTAGAVIASRSAHPNHPPTEE